MHFYVDPGPLGDIWMHFYVEKQNLNVFLDKKSLSIRLFAFKGIMWISIGGRPKNNSFLSTNKTKTLSGGPNAILRPLYKSYRAKYLL